MLSRRSVQLLRRLWTVAQQARTLVPGDLPYPGIEPQSLMPSALALYNLRYRGKPYHLRYTGNLIIYAIGKPLYNLCYTGKPYITYATEGNPHITHAIIGNPISPTLYRETHITYAYRETLYNLCDTGKPYIIYAI